MTTCPILHSNGIRSVFAVFILSNLDAFFLSCQHFLSFEIWNIQLTVLYICYTILAIHQSKKKVCRYREPSSMGAILHNCRDCDRNQHCKDVVYNLPASVAIFKTTCTPHMDFYRGQNISKNFYFLIE